ncbi:hypothetical protein AK812_SmicGene48956, partial [Symbiodinium microadriaticum]
MLEAMVKVTSKCNFQVAAYMALLFAFVVGLVLIGLPHATPFSKR